MKDTMLKLYVRFQNIQDLLSNEEGQDLVEYALLVALISVGAIAAMGPLAKAVSGIFTSVTSTLNAA